MYSTLIARRCKRFAVALAAMIAVTSIQAVVSPPRASAADEIPSVKLPEIQSVAVQADTMGGRAPDQATTNAVRGNQPATATKDGAGVSSATSLSPSATWDVSEQTGDFTWSYPLRVPPAPGGLQPSLAFAYRSSEVDGRTSVTNNQPSWVGDGWSLSPGFIERSYGGCADDSVGGTTPPKTGDLCWRSDNATASFAGGGGTLIRDDATGSWRAKSDDGSRVERLTGAGNGDTDGEHWRITTVDGTQYHFGSQAQSNSTWTVPVFGDDANEPCHASTFETSHCAQGWRWNLDKVVDRRGNVVRYFYDTEANAYGLNLKDTAVSYTRGGTLRRVEYGLRDDLPGQAATGVVEFATADRCVKDSVCALDQKPNWPDTPLDDRCDTATCPNRHSPSFFSTKRLASITTKVLRGNAYTDVDRWDLDQEFPKPGDGEKPALWLRGITHTGLIGGALTLPPVVFEGTAMPNRVDAIDGIAPLNRYRITGVVSETGGVITVDYAEPECEAGGLMPPNPESNTLRCFPVRWNKKDHAERTDYFHKHVVAQIVESDRLSTSTAQVTSYHYLDGAAWHWDSSEFTPEAKKTWNEYRGFARVRTRTGSDQDPSGPITEIEQRFHRGMHGDKLPSGTRSVTVTDSAGGVRTDHDWLSGVAIESATHNGVDGPVVAKTITEPVWQGPTATRGAFQAYLVRAGTSRGFTALEQGGWRTTRAVTTYDERGLPTQVNDLGDIEVGSDDRCVRTTYARNTDRWLLDLPSRVEVVAVDCATPAVFPGHALGDARLSYDGQAPGAAPVIGNLTRTEVARSRPAGGPDYVTTATARYDGHGRVIESTDALGATSRIAYTPPVGGPVTATTTTSPPTPSVPGGIVTTVTLDPALGLSTAMEDANELRTDVTYDPLGRRTEVWLPNRPKADNPEGSLKFGYDVRNDRPSVVTTSAIGPKGTYTRTTTLFDGLMRPRQVQADAVGGGRLLSDTRYDSHGRVYKSTQPYYNSAARDTALWLASDTEVPSLTLSQYDGASRPVATVYQAGATEKWRTTTAYGGDRVHVTPPAGGTATTTITDARSRTVEVRQYSAPTPVGDYDSTRYRYTPTGQMAEMIDPAGNTWRHTYDLRGRKTRTEDPDRGVSFSTFDDANRLTSTTDSRDITIAHTYDALGRKTATLRDNVTGPKLAEWTYDTAVGGVGLPATSTRFDDGHAYIGSVFSYDAFGRPTERSVTIPAKEGLLAGRYTAFYNWDTDGGLSGESYPKTPDLRQETVNYVRDGDGRYLSSSGAYDGTVNLVTGTEYTRYGEPQRIQLGKTPKRAWLSYYYDTNDRRLNRTIVDAEVARPMQADLNYTYDLAGNITGIADTVQEQPADTQRFRYDYLRRLTQAWTQGAGCVADPSIAVVGGPSPYWHSYTYDKTGDRATEIHHNVTGDTQRTYAYPVPGTSQPHTLASVTTSRPGQSPTVDTYKYDQAGNTIRRTRDGDEESLTWDAEGHLSTITNAGGTTTSVYDAEGQLLVRRDPTGSTLLLDRQEVRQDKGATVTKTTRYYTFVGKTIASRQGPALTWLATDHQSTSQISIDTATMTAAKRRQYPFGDPRGAEPTMWQGLHGFVGGTKDLSTGLTRLGVRDYDPMVGRFLSVDPIQDPADPQQWNGYSYANNSPITFSDPTGLVPYPGEENTDRLGRHHGGDGMGGATVDQSPTTRGPVVTSDHGNNVRTTHVPRTKEKWANDVQLPPSAPDLQELGRRMSERFGRGLHGRPGGQVHMKETLLALMAACGTLSEDFCSDDFHHWAMYEYLEILAMTGELSGTRGIAKRGDGFTSTQGRNFPGRRAPGSCEGHSFIAGTEVLMADETHKKIEDVEIGDLVIATDSETGRTEARPVVRTWAHGDEFERTEIVVDTDGDAGSAGGTVTATDWHRIWEPTLKEWTPIGELSVGSRVQSSTGESAQVVAVVKYKGAGKVYDLSIEGIHTYYVGTAGIGADLDVLVHNTPPSNRCAVFSSIGDDEFLIKAAQKAGRSQAVQAEMDDLIAKYARGLKDPGLGTKALGQGTDISYLRGDNGARVFFRTTNEGIQIVGKADKRSEDSVISRLKQIYGR